MPVPLDFLHDPWADTGDRAVFPYQPDYTTELMSWLKGFTAKYQRIPEEGGVYIERREFNQILWLLTKQIIDAFAITASDEQLNAEIAARIAADDAERAARTAADADLQAQLNAKFMSIKYNGSFNVGTTYYVDEPCFMILRVEVAGVSKYQYMNAEVLRNTGSTREVDTAQFVFGLPYGWNEAPSIPDGGKGNITLTAFMNAGDSWIVKGETAMGFDSAGGLRGIDSWIIK